MQVRLRPDPRGPETTGGPRATSPWGGSPWGGSRWGGARWGSPLLQGIFRDFELITFIFLILDLLIYFDRGILPGLHEEVKRDLPQPPEFYFGVLQSTFIGGLAISAPLLAYMSIKIRNLLIFVAIGLALWNLSLFGCCLSAVFKQLIPLFVFRAMSGIGEAAFSSLVVPAMVDCQPPERRGIFLGVFYALMPLGVSLGYIISSALPVLLNLSYAAAFGFLGSAALPYTLVVLAISWLPEASGLSPWKFQQSSALNDDLCRPETAEQTPKQRREDLESGRPLSTSAYQVARRATRSPQIQECVLTVTTAQLEDSSRDYNALFFMSFTMAGAALAAINATFAAFGSALLLDLGIFKTEIAASSSVGSVAIGVGAAGTFAGGMLTQIYMNRIQEDDRVGTGKATSSLVFLAGLCGSISALVSPALLFYEHNLASLCCLSLGLFFLCLCQAPLNLGVMSSCKKSHRALALSLYTLAIHFLGDVPGPIIIGWLKDKIETVDCLGEDELGCLEIKRWYLIQLVTFMLLWTLPIWVGGGAAWVMADR